MDEVKQVKVDNWGTFFLQRLKHFFNRTDYCDLTLQFQDKAQLKVHRLVLSACTEYFELLERTCEMYEDCLVMPDDLQSDVVVPIINFMYTGHLEFSMDILEKLYQTSLVMNMPVLTTLLESHRNPINTIKPPFNRNFSKQCKPHSSISTINTYSTNVRSNKRPYTVAFENSNLNIQTNKVVIPSPQNPMPPLNMNKVKMVVSKDPVSKTISVNKFGMSPYYNKRLVRGEAKPTRCELPEELENDDNTFTNSFMNISYESKPLVVHPETKAQAKKNSIFNKPSSSKNSSSIDILECKKISRSCSLFDEKLDVSDEYEIPHATITNLHHTPRQSAAQLFDQIVENEENDNFNKPKVTIETSDCKQSANLDHAKIISEVLKKYPHLVNSNKNIKLKVLNTNRKPSPKRNPQGKQKHQIASPGEDKIDYINRDILDTKEAAKLVALGVANVGGPWICLICGTPSKALRFGSYYYYRRHLVEVHNEKPATRMCEYCGLKTPKRNFLIHHLLTKHGVDPPMQYNFPRCNMCNYIGLSEANLAKHKMNHIMSAKIKCNVCNRKFTSTNQLLEHIQQTGHKITGERKANIKCIYCLRVFIREGNLYAHIKANHKNDAIRDGVIDNSDEEKEKDELVIKKEGLSMKHEEYSSDYEEDGQDIQYMSQKLFKKYPTQKILNTGLPSQKYQIKSASKPGTIQIIKQQNLIQDQYTTSSVEDEELVEIDGEEFFLHNNQLVKYMDNAKRRNIKDEYVLSDMGSSQEFIIQQHEITNETQYIEQLPTLKKHSNSHEPVFQTQIVVANDEEYDTLMSSNTTAIFDENTSKTLTVLTTPDRTSLAPADIDVPETVPNSMMLIPDDYPLNVTAAETSIDSNIMVVYSQPAEITNKSYQIITTGNGEQYVQTSDVASNIETLSVPAATNEDNTSAQPEHLTQQVESTHVETVVEEPVTAEAVIEKDINDILPQDALSEQLPTETLEVEQENIEMSQTFTQDETELQNNQEDNIVISDNEHIHKGSVVDHEESLHVENQNNSVDVPQVEHSDIVMEVLENNEIITYATDFKETENQTVVNQNDDSLDKQENVEMADENQINAIVPEVVKEKIQTLTSEWSEDETEVVKQEIPPNHEADSENITEPEEELEESIENIQKAMNEHNLEKPLDLQNNPEETILSNAVPIPKNIDEEPKTAIEGNIQPPQEKISSLLNEWEDNDTQDGQNGEENGKTEDCDHPEEIQQDIEMEHEVPKDDKIKNLVSDWDDDEEEQ